LPLELARDVIWYIFNHWESKPMSKLHFMSLLNNQLGVMRTATVKRSEIGKILRDLLYCEKQNEKSAEQQLSEIVTSVYELHQIGDKKVAMDEARPLIKFVISRLRGNTELYFKDDAFNSMFQKLADPSGLVDRNDLTKIAQKLALVSEPPKDFSQTRNSFSLKSILEPNQNDRSKFLKATVQKLLHETMIKFDLKEGQMLRFVDTIKPIKYMIGRLNTRSQERPDFYMLAGKMHFREVAEGMKTIEASQLAELTIMII
jgi:hypothetical protein